MCARVQLRPTVSLSSATAAATPCWMTPAVQKPWGPAGTVRVREGGHHRTSRRCLRTHLVRPAQLYRPDSVTGGQAYTPCKQRAILVRA